MNSSERRRFVVSFAIAIAIALGFAVALAQPAAAQRTGSGSVSGTVSSASGSPIDGATIVIAGTDRRVMSNATGRFTLTGLADGTYRVLVRAIGYVPSELANVVVGDSTTRVIVTLAATAPRLAEVVVSPGQVSVATDRVVPSVALTQRDIESLPRIGEDMYRALTRLAGIGSNEYSAKLRLHNSSYDDLLVRLDGVELYEPFHLKDYDGSLSLIDADAISMVTLSKGGFSVDQGNHVAGVLDMRSKTGAGERDATSMSLSLSGMRIASGGSFADDRGAWRFTARRGYLDILLRMIEGGESLSPSYWDALASVRYDVGAAHHLSVHVLGGFDVTHSASEGDPTLDSRYGNHYVWSTWQAAWSDRLSTETVASVASLRWQRTGSNRPEDGPFAVSDKRSMRDLGLRQDWSFALSERQAVRWGGELHALSADYDYTRSGFNGQGSIDTGAFALEPDGAATSAYASYRIRPLDRVTAEVGVRYDRYDYAPGSTLTPRASVAVNATPRTTIRVSLGDYAQAHGIHQLGIQDGDTTFYQPERATHTTVGIEQQLSARTTLTVDAYGRREYRRHPRLVNLTTYIESFPEARSDRRLLVAPTTDARGIDLSVRGATGDNLTWSGSYSLAKATDHLSTFDAPRAYEQRHTVYLDVAYSPSPKWQFGIGWQYHTGWPSTTPQYSIRELTPEGAFVDETFPRYHDTRLPAYHRLDLRASRRFYTRSGVLTLYADIFNAYDRGNVSGYEYQLGVRNGNLIVTPVRETTLPILPSLGITWQF